jgi:hypothetical protein
MQMSFLGDNSGTVHKFFYKWLNGIVKYDELPRGKKGYNGLRPFEVEYKRAYATDITITCVDEVEKKLIEVKLIDAYPIFLDNISLNWSDSDSIAKIPVTFTYYQWKRTDISINLADILDDDLSPVQRVLAAGTAIQALAKTGVPRNINDITSVVNNSKSAIGNIGALF